MPIIEASPTGEGGFGCTCPSFRRRQDKVFPSLVKAADVSVEFVKREPDGTEDWKAWTRETVYQVSYSPTESGGWCKHVAAVLAHKNGFMIEGFKQLKVEVEIWQNEKKQLTRELKRLSRSLAKQKTPRCNTSSTNGAGLGIR